MVIETNYTGITLEAYETGSLVLYSQDSLKQDFGGPNSCDVKNSSCSSVLKIGFGATNLAHISHFTNE